MRRKLHSCVPTWELYTRVTEAMLGPKRSSGTVLSSVRHHLHVQSRRFFVFVEFANWREIRSVLEGFYIHTYNEEQWCDAVEGGIRIIDDLSSAHTLPIELFTGRYKAELSAPSRGTPPPTCLVNCQLFNNYFSEWLHVLETFSNGAWEHGGASTITRISLFAPRGGSIFQLAVSQAFAILPIRMSDSLFHFLYISVRNIARSYRLEIEARQERGEDRLCCQRKKNILVSWVLSSSMVENKEIWPLVTFSK